MLSTKQLPGLLFIAVVATSAVYIADLSAIKTLRLSPLIIGILLGAFIGNTLQSTLPEVLSDGITFCVKTILRLAIILYGFRITFGQIAELGVSSLILDVLMVSSTLILGAIVGTRFLKLDRATALMTSSGAAICGAAAVVATEPVVKAENHQTAAAVVTVVVFGTLSMFLYPILYRAGFIDMDPSTFGVYIGASVHEVAHVVGAGEAVGPETADTAVIVKMTRVLLLAPALICMGWFINRNQQTEDGEPTPLAIPWFAIGFIGVAGFNSLNLLPKVVVDALITVDTFLLTMAMTALGINTVWSKFKGMGMGPMYLAIVLFLWLVFAGYGLTKLLVT